MITALNHYSSIFVNGVSKVPNAVVKKGIEKWRKYLVGNFIRKKLPFFWVSKEIEKILKTNSFDLSSDNDRYFIKTKDFAHRHCLQEGG